MGPILTLLVAELFTLPILPFPFSYRIGIVLVLTWLAWLNWVTRGR